MHLADKAARWQIKQMRVMRYHNPIQANSESLEWMSMLPLLMMANMLQPTSGVARGIEAPAPDDDVHEQSADWQC